MTTVTAQRPSGVTTQTATEKTLKENSAGAIQDRFYTLLITQIKNQDPLSPMQNAEVTSQMAQLSTLTGIEKMNASLATMGANMRANMIGQASSLLGRSVVAEGSTVDVGAENPGTFALEVPTDIQKLTVNVIDTRTGRIAKTIDQTTPDVGYAKFDLSALPEGRYRLDVRATDAEGKAVAGVKSLVQGRVTSLIPDGDDMLLTLSNGQSTKMSAIYQLSVA